MAAPFSSTTPYFSAFGAGHYSHSNKDKFLRTQVIGGTLFSKKHPDAHGVLRYVENVEYVNT